MTRHHCYSATAALAALSLEPDATAIEHHSDCSTVQECWHNQMDLYRAVSNKNMTARSTMRETNRKAWGFDATRLTSANLQDRASTECPHNKTTHPILSTRCLCEKVTTTMTPCWCKPCDMNSLSSARPWKKKSTDMQCYKEMSWTTSKTSCSTGITNYP